MQSRKNVPQSRFSRLLASASDIANRNARSSDLDNLPDEVIWMAEKGCRLLPQVAVTGDQPVHDSHASSDLLQLSAWADEYPDCGWTLLTGLHSGIIMLEAESDFHLAAVRDLQQDDVEETLRVLIGGRSLVFYRYPQEMQALLPGSMVLMPGLVVQAGESRVLLPTDPDSWPDPEAAILEAPDWLRHCAFDQVQAADPLPRRLQIVGGTQRRKGRI